MVVAVATEARGVATVAVAMRAVAMVAAVAEGTIYYARCGSARHHPASHGQPQPHCAAETVQPCRLRLVPQPDTPADCSLLSSCARVWHMAVRVKCTVLNSRC